jgi:hypothetical protein
MQKGDVLLLGLTRLDAATAGLCLVSRTDWVLGPLTLLEDGPTMVSVALNEWRMGLALPEAEEGAESDQVVFQPRIGQAHVPLGRIKRWAPEQRFDLGKDPEAPVRLVGVHADDWCGEFVRIDQQLGVRLLGTWPPSQEHSADHATTQASKHKAAL